jgi:hypothetical protein
MPSESPQESAYVNQQQEEVTPPVSYRAPTPEESSQLYLPYRGSQFHGVDPGRIAVVADEDTEGGKVVTGYFEPGDEDINPVPVRIVETAAHEFSEWRAYQSYAGAAPTMVVNAKSGRQNCKLRNLSATIRVWLGPANTVTAITGYPLDAGAEISFTGEAAVWAISNDGSTVTLAVLTEFSTAQ